MGLFSSNGVANKQINSDALTTVFLDMRKRGRNSNNATIIILYFLVLFRYLNHQHHHRFKKIFVCVLITDTLTKVSRGRNKEMEKKNVCDT